MLPVNVGWVEMFFLHLPIYDLLTVKLPRDLTSGCSTGRLNIFFIGFIQLLMDYLPPSLFFKEDL